VPLKDVRSAETKVEGLWITPATTDLSSADIELVERKAQLPAARRAAPAAIDRWARHGPDRLPAVAQPADGQRDGGGAFGARPAAGEFFALEGLSQLMLTVREVRQTANPGLRIEGVVLTMYDRRNNLASRSSDARENLGIWCSAPSFPATCASARRRPSRCPSSTTTRCPGQPRLSRAGAEMIKEPTRFHNMRMTWRCEGRPNARTWARPVGPDGRYRATVPAPAAPRRADMMVPVDRMRPNPDQPRRSFTRTQLEELAARSARRASSSR
jgi:hypothetical protein